MTVDTRRPLAPRPSFGRIVPLGSRRSWVIVERDFMVYRNSWFVFLTGFLEPVFYLLSIGIGVGGLVGGFTLADGSHVDYATFVAPAMLATSAMNGAIYDSTYGLFFRLKYAKLYDAILATPLGPLDVAWGELTWALLRGGTYSAGFIVVMALLGYVGSWWIILALPATLLIGFAFGGAGMALCTRFKSWQDFEYVQLAIMPMFLFSGTFFPISNYPEWMQIIVKCTPLYQSVVLCRDLSLGTIGVECLVAVAYLIVMGTIGVSIAARRIGALLLT